MSAPFNAILTTCSMRVSGPRSQARDSTVFPGGESSGQRDLVRSHGWNRFVFVRCTQSPSGHSGDRRFFRGGQDSDRGAAIESGRTSGRTAAKMTNGNGTGRRGADLRIRVAFFCWSSTIGTCLVDEGAVLGRRSQHQHVAPDPGDHPRTENDLQHVGGRPRVVVEPA